MSIEAMKLALEALDMMIVPRSFQAQVRIKEIYETIEAELAKQEQGEPVAWRLESGQAVWFERTDPEASSALPNDVTAIPLYTTPQQRTWVGLTDEEMREIEKQFEAERVRTSDEEYLVIYPAAYWQWQRAIEAKLKSKNR